jgi:hypothetical protein
MPSRSLSAFAIACLLCGCPGGATSTPSLDLGPPVFLVEPGELRPLDADHRISLAPGFRIVSRLPDAPWLFYRSGPDLLAIRFSGLPPVRIATTGKRQGGTGTRSWSADGTRLFDYEEQVFSLDLRTLMATELTHLPPGGELPVWTPGHVHMPVRYHHDPQGNRLVVLLERFSSRPFAGSGPFPRDVDTVALAIDLDDGAEHILFSNRGRFRSWAACPVRRLLYVSYGDRLEVRDMDGALLRTLRVPALATSELTVSPDGTRLLAEGPYTPGKPNQGFTVHDAADGTCLSRHAEGSSPRWDPSGTRIAFVRNWSELWLYDTAAGSAAPLFAVDTCIAQAHAYGSPPSWSADGRFLAVHVSASRGRYEHGFYTMIADLLAREILIVPEQRLHLSWLPCPVGQFD